MSCLKFIKQLILLQSHDFEILILLIILLSRNYILLAKKGIDLIFFFPIFHFN